MIYASEAFEVVLNKITRTINYTNITQIESHAKATLSDNLGKASYITT